MQREWGIIQGLLRAALFMLTGLALVFFVVLFGSRLTVNDAIRAGIEEGALENAGLAIEIGTVRGTWWSGLTLSDVKVHCGPRRDSPILGTVPIVQVEYTVLGFLGPRPLPLRIDAYQPNLALQIRANRIFNLSPRFREPHEEKPGDAPPPIDLVFHGGHVSYEDLTARKPFKVAVDSLTGSGSIRGFALALDLQALRTSDRLNAHIDYDLQHQRGAVDFHGRDLSLPYWVNRFGWAPQYTMTDGHADVDAKASWQDPMLLEELKVAGTARLYDGEANLINVAVPLTGLTGEITFDERVAHLPHLEGTIEGMPVIASGTVTHLLEPVPALGGPDMGLHLTVSTPAVELEKLDRLFPGIKNLHLAGLGNILANVDGTIGNPRVVMRGRVPSGHYGKEPCEHVLIDAVFTPGRFDLPHYQLDLARGHADGKAFVGIPERSGTPIPYTVDATFAGLELADWLERYRDEPLPFAVSGGLHGELHLRGTGGHQVTTARVAVAHGLMNHAPVQACTATYRYETPTWTVPAWSLDWGPTHLAGKAFGADNQPFHIAFGVAAGELKQWIHLNPHPPETLITGAASGSGEFGGLASDPNTWTGQAKLHVATGIFDKQSYRDADAAMTLAHNQVTIGLATAHTVDGLVRATGLYQPFILRGQEYPTSDFDVAATGMSLHEVATLPQTMKTARGALSSRFAVHIHNRDVTVIGHARIESPRLPGWSRLDRAEIDFHWTPEVATLQPMSVYRGADRYEITGTIGQLDDTYPLDLRVRAPRADVKTLLGAVQWPDVMARLVPAATRSLAPSGPLRELASLPLLGPTVSPDAEMYLPSKRQPGGYALSDGLDRWLSLHKPALHRPPPEPPLLPFWQECGGKFWLDAHLVGPVEHPAVRMGLRVQALKVFDRLIDDGTVTVSYDHGRLALPLLRVREGGRTIVTAAGVLSDQVQDALVVRTHGLDLDWSRRALASRQMRFEGRGDLMLRLSGPWASPHALATATISQGRFSGPGFDPIAFDAIDANVAYDHGHLAIQRATLRQDGKLASISGTVPVADAGPQSPIDLALSLEDANLAILNLFSQRRFQWLSGKGKLELRLGGTMGAPSLAGRIALNHGSFSVDGLTEPVTELSTDISLNNQRIDIRKLEGQLGGGDLNVAGTVWWDQFQPQRVDLIARARPFRLKLPNDLFNGMLGGELHLVGPVAEPTLGGQLALYDGFVNMREDAAKSKGAEFSLPAVRLDALNIALGPNLRLKNSLVDVGVTTQARQGHLVVDGSLAAPEPRGVVIIDSGTIRPLNNPFKIVEGKVEFLGGHLGGDDVLGILGPGAGPDAALAGVMNAHLDVQARTTAYDYSQDESVNVLAHVTGTLEQMDMRFTSEPLRSEQEILDILSKKQVLEGTFGGKLDRGEVIVKEVGGFVSSNIEDLVSPYTLFLRNALNLQTFRFELVSDATNAVDPGELAGYRPALTVETRPLYERLSFGSRLVLGEIFTSTPSLYGENSYVSLDYKLTRWLGVEYRIDPYIDPRNDRVLGQTLGLRTQITF